MSSTAAPNDASPHGHVVKIILAALGVLVYEGLVHWAVLSGNALRVGPLFSLAPIFMLPCLLVWRKSPVACVAGLLILGIGMIALASGHRPALDLKVFYPAPHITVYLLLLWFFGRTLRAGREPLVTRIARHEHGTLPAEIELYTRHVTWAWCIFFAIMAGTSALLFAFAPLAAWSWFANVLNIPLLILMFVAEYTFRVLRFPAFSHASFFTAIRAFRDLRRAAMMQRENVLGARTCRVLDSSVDQDAG